MLSVVCVWAEICVELAVWKTGQRVSCSRACSTVTFISVMFACILILVASCCCMLPLLSFCLLLLLKKTLSSTVSLTFFSTVLCQTLLSCILYINCFYCVFQDSVYAASLAAVSRVEQALSEAASSLSSFTQRPGPRRPWMLQIEVGKLKNIFYTETNLWLLLPQIDLATVGRCLFAHRSAQ